MEDTWEPRGNPRKLQGKPHQSLFTGDNGRAMRYIRHSMTPISTTKELADACATLRQSPFATVDTEFMREQTFWPKLCLIQMAGPDGEFIVDPLAPEIDLAPFWDLMADETTTKVFHAARQDVEIVFHETGTVPAPIFDTQVAAMVCGFGDSISYMNLVKRVTGAALDKSSRFTDWARRPLSDKQLAYAIGDVTHLRDIYAHLSAELEKTGRAAWLAEEMSILTDHETYEQKPENAWRRLKLRVKNKKALGVLMSIAGWREQVAQSSNVPRNRVFRDDALYDIANQAPRSPAELSKLRTVNDGFARSARAKSLLKAIEDGLKRDPATLPQVSQNQPLSPEATATLELLKVLLKSAAARHGVAPRLIADAAELEKLARHNKPDIQVMKGWRFELFGNDALRLKRGELALTLNGGDVDIIATRNQPTD